MRRSAISYAHVLQPSVVCARLVSSSLVFSCVMAVTTIGRQDIDAPSLDGRTEIRASGASHRAGRLHRRGRGGDGATRPFGSSYRGGAVGLVACPGGARPASAARDGSGRGGDGDRRTR